MIAFMVGFETAMKPFAIKGVFFSLLMVLVCLPAYTQGKKIIFKHLTVEDGLSDDTVHSIFQDSKGYMWFGTEDGLSTFDGYSFTNFFHDPDDQESVGGKIVRKVFQDSAGNLWAGSRGLSKYNYETGKFRNFNGADIPELDSGFLVFDVVETKPGIFWIATGTFGLIRFDWPNNEYKIFNRNVNEQAGIKHGIINCLLKEGKDRLWIGAANGLYLFDTSQEKVLKTYHEFDDSGESENLIVTDIEKSSSGDLIFGTRFSGLFVVESLSGEIRNFVHDPENNTSISFNQIEEILVDRDGDVWISTSGGGLNRFLPDEGKFLRYSGNAYIGTSLSNNYVDALFQDREGLIWLGHFSGGIDRFDPSEKRFALFKNDGSSNTLKGNSIFSLLREKQFLWIGTKKGLHRYNYSTGIYRFYNRSKNPQDGILDGSISAIYRTSDGVLWVSTIEGVFKYNDTNDTFSLYEELKDPSFGDLGRNVTRFYEDSKRNLWMTWHWEGKGITKISLSSGQIKNYQYQGENRESTIWRGYYCALEDKDGDILFGSQQNGLLVFDPEKESFRLYSVDRNNPDSINSTHVLSILQDSRGLIWMGTYGGGLNLFNKEQGRFRSFTRKDGLSSDEIYSVIEDSSGCLWMSTNHGIIKVTVMGDYSDPVKVVPTFTNYDTGYGSMGNEFNVGAYCKGPDSLFYFGGLGGVFVVDTDELRDDSPGSDPELRFTDFRVISTYNQIRDSYEEDIVLNSVVNETPWLKLEHFENTLSLSFSLLTYKDPESNEYSYKMEGINDDWVFIGNRHVLDFNLSPGIYTLKIRGRQAGMEWSRKIKEIGIQINFPFWDTAYFKAIIVLIIVLAVVGFFQVRTLVIRRRNEELRAINDKLNSEISVRKRTENSLREAQEGLHLKIQEVSELNKNLEAFDYSVSNALRVPLRHAEGYTNIVLDAFSSDLGDDITGYIKKVSRSIGESRELVDNLLRLSRANRQGLQFAEVNLSKLADKAVEKALAEYQAPNITIQIEEDVMCKGDFRLLLNVMNVLIDNAVKFTRNCANPTINFGCQRKNDTRVYFIKDNGVGFEQERGLKIFEPFHAYHTDVNFEGVGLSLATAERIISRHKGGIWAEGKVGKGATFFFSLSARQNQTD